MTPVSTRLTLAEIETRVCDVASRELGIDRSAVVPASRIIEDLNCDSLDLVELFMAIEDEFDICLPDAPSDPVLKQVFNRRHFRLMDLAELVYLLQGTGRIESGRRFLAKTYEPARRLAPFTQLGGGFDAPTTTRFDWYESLGKNPQGFKTFRRRTDGMICVRIPAGRATLGSEASSAQPDERPVHRASMDSFLIDSEPVSTTAYARFLNSIGVVDSHTLAEWFILSDHDHRRACTMLQRSGGEWAPVAGVEMMPMVLVSWYGASAYSLWANGLDWRAYKGDGRCAPLLPTEAQWEYAARGEDGREYPWGNEEPDERKMRFGAHARGRTYEPRTMPMAPVNADLAVSAFGLRHMSGNVWQWCADWYAQDFYAQSESRAANPANLLPTGIRSERGGSWIGPAFLCRSSYRRGRAPIARGRCLGFRCVGTAGD